jgi:hypothetical protein
MLLLTYKDILQQFTRSKINFCVIGGFAAVAHGVVRVTMDLDLAILTVPKNLSASWDLLNKLGFECRIPITKNQFQDPNFLESASIEKGLKAVSFFHRDTPFIVVDLLFTKEFQFTKKDIVLMDLFDVSVPVISLKNLIGLKKLAGRPKDLEDIRELKKKIKK